MRTSWRVLRQPLPRFDARSGTALLECLLLGLEPAPTAASVQDGGGNDPGHSTGGDRFDPRRLGTAHATSITRLLRLPPVVAASTALTRAAELLVRPGASLLVVVDERRRPLGVVTATEVLALARRLTPARFEQATVLDAARSGGRFVPETSTLRSVHSALLDENREFFVVVDAEGRLAGMVTAMDVLEALEGSPPVSGTWPIAALHSCR